MLNSHTCITVLRLTALLVSEKRVSIAPEEKRTRGVILIPRAWKNVYVVGY